jgi:hypothetical protein
MPWDIYWPLLLQVPVAIITVSVATGVGLVFVLGAIRPSEKKDSDK